jgi:hypothetical protein
MRKRRILSEGVLNHPAVEAWAAATSLAAVPECIYVYREHPGKALYLLPGVAPGGSGVFAKRARASTMAVERTVYTEILPRLPLTAPRCYGSWVDEPHGWLFVEDVGSQRYSPDEPQHLAVAAHWIGTLHATAAEVPAARALPDGGPARYLNHLRAALETIAHSLDAWPYPRNEIDALAAVLSQCAALEARWERVEAECEGAPATVVHGDFQSKNVYVRTDTESTRLFPIDWELVGWGPPAADLADPWLTRVDLETYWTVVREAWPQMGLDRVARQAMVGRLLSGCAAIDWECVSLLAEDARGRSHAVARLEPLIELLTEAARAGGILD